VYGPVGAWQGFGPQDDVAGGAPPDPALGGELSGGQGHPLPHAPQLVPQFIPQSEEQPQFGPQEDPQAMFGAQLPQSCVHDPQLVVHPQLFVHPQLGEQPQL
jgi:hypothetical protein